MKILIKAIAILTLSLNSFASEIIFEAPKLEDYTSVPSYEDELITVGGVEVSRKQLREYSGLDEINPNCYKVIDNKTIFDNKTVQFAVNGALAAAAIHTALLDDRPDLQKHFLVGAAIGGGATYACQKIFVGDDNKIYCMIAGSLVGALAAGAKEYRDSKGHGTPDVKDFVYTAIPAILVSIKVSHKF